MAGYSATPLAKKLGIKEGHRVALIGATPAFPDDLEPLPPWVQLLRSARSPVNVIVAFFDRESRLINRLPGLLKLLKADGGLWLAWPKKSSGLPTDLSFDRVQHLGLDAGLVDNKICAIDEQWSGLRLVVRLQDRDQWPVR